jgi:hypothetical protein
MLKNNFALVIIRFIIGASLGSLIGLLLTFFEVPIVIGICLSLLLGSLSAIYGDRFIVLIASVFKYL